MNPQLELVDTTGWEPWQIFDAMIERVPIMIEANGWERVPDRANDAVAAAYGFKSWIEATMTLRSQMTPEEGRAFSALLHRDRKAKKP